MGEQPITDDDMTSQQPSDDELAFPDLKPGDAWGDSITKQRAAELEALLQAWDAEKEHGERRGPFDRGGTWVGIPLTGADAFWLMARAIAGELGGQSDKEGTFLAHFRLLSNDPVHSYRPVLHLEGADLSNAHLEGADLPRAHLEGAYLDSAHLEGARLLSAHLEDAHLSGAHLEGAILRWAHLERSRLMKAHVEGADLLEAHLEDASLLWAHLERANFLMAHLDHAIFEDAYLQDAILMRAHLEDARFRRARLDRADLRWAIMDSSTDLTRVVLGDGTSGYVSVADVRWGDANLAVLNWTRTTRGLIDIRERIEAIELGEERNARMAKDSDGKLKDKAWRLREYKDAVRANHQLATVLRQQGLNDDADKFAYKAQQLQGHVFRLQRQWGRWLLQTALAGLAGYGYRLERILAAYGIVLLGFTILYSLMGVHSSSHEPGWQAVWDSFLISLSAIHGRTMFEQVGAWSSAAWFAAIESVFGIVIEGIFVAILIQRFFAR